ncbi:class I SAM-dependent methyltransferase [Alcanivorax sp.]|uniref:class I SAM-dependent methyltransferase n=1 Tax=Alcanivorax sp. TaxID=1872427 RepID=UPI002586E133|nr:class I SAM-dependent methyltransferase [Alcanivorax sp.]
MNRSFWDEEQVVDAFGQSYYFYGAERRLCQEYFTQGGMILDLGCGAGRTTLLLHEGDYNVIGVDLSLRMLSHMKRRFPYIRAIAANAAALPFDSEVFDGVLFSYNGLSLVYPMEARQRAIAEIHRVLKPNGKFIFSAHNKIGIILNTRDRSRRTIPERWFALRHLFVKGYVYEKGIKSHVYYSNVKDLVSELERHGFLREATYDRNGRFGIRFAQWFDPWPYYCFSKR